MKKAVISLLILLVLAGAVLAVKYYKPVVDESACVGCEDCIRVCPVKAIEMQEEKAVIADSLCIDCRQCVKSCPQHAIRTPK